MAAVALVLGAARLIGGRNYWMITGPRSRKAANLAANPQAAFTVDDTVESLAVEGHAAAVTDDDRREAWIERYLTTYQALAPDLGADFLRRNVVVELVPDRAFAVVERADEFATRATRWRFDG